MTLKLKEHRSHPPYTVDALVSAANSFLQPRGAAPVTKRTLRFYTTQGVVPSPLGSPKFARYGYEHLLTLLAARALQDQGSKLEQIRDDVREIADGKVDRIEGVVDVWLAQRPATRGRVLQVREDRAEYGAKTKLAAVSQPTVRIQLTETASLELKEEVASSESLVAAHKALGKLIEKIDK